jgi:zinc protease
MSNRLLILAGVLMALPLSDIHAAELLEGMVLPNGRPVSHYQLGNGLQIYCVENHSAPVFTFQVWFKVGARDEKLDPRLNATGLAHFFEHMMFRGTPSFADGEFDRILTRNGVDNENATTWLDRTNYYESLPSEKLELVVQLESDRMVNLVINQELLDTERGAVLGEYHMGLDDPESVAYDKLYETAFTTHPYRYTTIGTEEEIRRFTKEDAEYFYRKYYAPNNATILMVGDVNPAQAIAVIEKYYGGIPSQVIDRIPSPVEPPQIHERPVQFRHPQLRQEKLFLGYHTPEASHADQPALLVAQSMLTLGEGALLQSEWVNTGFAVGLNGSLNQLRDPGLFIIGADLQVGHHAEELLGILDRKIGEITEATQFAREVERAKNQLLLQIYQQWQENNSLAGFMGEFIASAGDPMVAFAQTAAIEQVTPADVKQVIAKYLVHTNRTVVVGIPDLKE